MELGDATHWGQAAREADARDEVTEQWSCVVSSHHVAQVTSRCQERHSLVAAWHVTGAWHLRVSDYRGSSRQKLLQ